MRRWAVQRVFVVIILLVLALSAICEFWLLPAEVTRAGELFPEVRPIQTLGLVVGIIATSLWQSALILLLIVMHRNRRGVGPQSRLVAWIVGLLLAILLLAIAALILLNQLGFGTPGVMLGLILVGALAVAVAIAVRLAFVDTR